MRVRPWEALGKVVFGFWLVFDVFAFFLKLWFALFLCGGFILHFEFEKYLKKIDKYLKIIWFFFEKYLKNIWKYLQNESKRLENWKNAFFTFFANILHFLFFCKIFANLQFPGTTSEKAGKLQKNQGNLQKMKNIWN